MVLAAARAEVSAAIRPAQRAANGASGLFLTSGTTGVNFGLNMAQNEHPAGQLPARGPGLSGMGQGEYWGLGGKDVICPLGREGA